MALETLLPGFGHDLSLHLGNSLFQIFRLKVGCPDQQRYRVQGSYNEDSMCSMQAMHRGMRNGQAFANSSSKGYDGIYIYICCRRPLPQNLEISSEFQTMLHVVKSCLKCSLNENCTNVNNPQAISQVKIQKQETFKYNVPICSIILRHVLCKCWSRGLPAKTKLLLPGVFYQVGRGLS